MRDKIFIDSNIFVYAYTDDDCEKHELFRILLKDNVLASALENDCKIVYSEEL
jgi:predicted nucleic acid-binding protein